MWLAGKLRGPGGFAQAPVREVVCTSDWHKSLFKLVNILPNSTYLQPMRLQPFFTINHLTYRMTPVGCRSCCRDLAFTAAGLPELGRIGQHLFPARSHPAG